MAQAQDQDQAVARPSPVAALLLVSPARRGRVVVARGADRLYLARGVPDQDQGDRNGLRASAVLPGLRAPALRLRRFPRKPFPAVCPCAPSVSSSSSGKPGSIRPRKNWPRKQRRQPMPRRTSRRASHPRLRFRQQTLPFQNKFIRSPRRQRNPVRGQTKHSRLSDCKSLRHEGKVQRATSAKDQALPQAR